MKTLIFGYLLLAVAFYLVGVFGYLGLSEMEPLQRQTFVLLVNLKWLAVVGAYIAWRVTPNA